MIFVLLFLYSSLVFASSQKIQSVGDRYYFSYSFRDHDNAFREFKWEYDKWEIDTYIESFGLTEQQSQRVRATQSEIQASNMYQQDGTLYFNYTEIVNSSLNITRPLYKKFYQISKKYGLDRRSQIELIMRFLQDIPYQIPPVNYKSRFIAGLFPPSELIKNGWGDCDSKSVMMASILSHDPFFYDKMAIVLVPGHALLGIQYVPGTYDQYTEYMGTKYIYSEPVGPDRTPFGQVNSPYSNGIEVFPIVPKGYSAPSVADLDSNSYAESTPSESESSISAAVEETACPDNGFLVEYERPFAPEIVKSCQAKRDGDFFKHGPTKIISKKSGKVMKEEVYSWGQQIR